MVPEREAEVLAGKAAQILDPGPRFEQVGLEGRIVEREDAEVEAAVD